MLRHVVALTFTEQTPSAEIDAIADALRALPSSIPAIRSYTVGRDLGLAPGTADLVVIGDFDDETGYVSYRDDAEHQRIINERILPALSARAASQFLV